MNSFEMDKENEHTKCGLFELPQIKSENGNLSFIEEIEHYSFKVQRAYWLYNIPANETRDGHAYKQNEEIIIALSGSFEVVVRKHNEAEKVFNLYRSSEALYVPNFTWRQLRSFSTNSVALLLSSHPFSEEDYIRNFIKFSEMREGE